MVSSYQQQQQRKIKGLYDDTLYGQRLSLSGAAGRTSETPTLSAASKAKLSSAVAGTVSQPKRPPPGYDKLTPLEQSFSEIFPGIAPWILRGTGAVGGGVLGFAVGGPVGAVVGGAAGATFIESILDTKVGDWLFKGLDYGAEVTEKAIGTAYLIANDDQLEALRGTQMKGTSSLAWLDIATDPKKRALFLSAWRASSMFYESIAPKDVGGLLKVSQALGGFEQFSPFASEEEKEQVRIEQQEIWGEWDTYWGEQKEHWRKVFAGEPLPDIGGLPQLIAMREQIFSGRDPDEVLTEYQQSLGMLAFRGQMFDSLGHIVADPINFIMPKLKPVEKGKALTEYVLAARKAPQVTQAVDDIKRAQKLFLAAEDVAEKSRLADDMVRIADSLETATFSKIDELSDITLGLKKAVESGEGLDKAIGRLDDIMRRFDEVKDASLMERKVAALFGGDPLNPPDYYFKLTNATKNIPLGSRLVGGVLRFFTLTSESRARIFVNNISDTLRIITAEGNIADPRTPYLWVQNFAKGAAGAFGDRLGHMFITPVGRHVQAVLKASMTKFAEALTAYDALKTQREMAYTIARLLDDSPGNIVKMLQAGESNAVFQRLTKLVGTQPGVKLLDDIGAGLVKQQDLVKLGEILRSTKNNIIPWTPELLRGKMLSDMLEVAAKLAETQFGVKEIGIFRKATEAMKSVESLLLLGLNGLYPVNNFFNGELTMIARGLFNMMTTDQALKYWDEAVGFRPSNLMKGFGISGEEAIAGVSDIEKAAMKILDDARWGDNQKFLKTVRDAARKPKLARSIAAITESRQRLRATTSAHMKVFPQIKKGMISGMDVAEPGLREALNIGDPNLARAFEEAVQSSLSVNDIGKLRQTKNLNWNVESIIRQAGEQLGMPTETLRMFLGEEVLEGLRRVVDDIKLNPTAERISSGISDMKRTFQDGLEAAYVRELEYRAAEYAAKIETEGIHGVAMVYGEVADSIFARQVAHTMRLDEQVPKILDIENAALRNSAWKGILGDSDIAWRRTWQFQEAAFKGIADGLKGRGAKLTQDFTDGFRSLKKTTGDFITKRNKLWDDFFEDIVAKKFPDDFSRFARGDEIREILTKEYQNLIETTERAYLKMDTVVVNSFRDPRLRSQVSMWRSTIRRMRIADMESMADFRGVLAGVPRAEQAAMWRDYNFARRRVWANINLLENAGRRMVAGDPEALRMFSQVQDLPLFQARAAEAVEQAERLSLRKLDPVQQSDIFRQAELGFADTPVSELPPDLRTALQFQIEEMMSDMTIAKPGRRIMDYDVAGRGGLSEVSGISSSYPYWYSELNPYLRLADGTVLRGKAAVEEALNILVRGEGDTGYSIFGELRRIAFRELADGGLPEDFWKVMDEIGEEGVSLVPLSRAGEMDNFVDAIKQADIQIARKGIESLKGEEFRRASELLLEHGLPSENERLNQLINNLSETLAKLNKAGADPQLLKLASQQISDIRSHFQTVLDRVQRRKFLGKATDMGARKPPVQPIKDTEPFMADFDSLVGRIEARQAGIDEVWFEFTAPMVDEVERRLLAMLDEKPTSIAKLPAATQAQLDRYLNRATGELRNAQLVSSRLSEKMADGVMLNYSRQYGFDVAMGYAAPFPYWWTHSIASWLVNSVDRPAMLSTYFKMERFLNEVVGDKENFPSRLRGRVKISLPFVPEEFGEIWLDPGRMFGLPFEQFFDPYVNLMRENESMQYRIGVTLGQMVESGAITQQQYANALSGNDPALYDRAKGIVLDQDSTQQYDVMDFMSMSTSAHLPYQIAWNILKGRPERIGPLPFTRTLKGVAGLLGIKVGAEGVDKWGNMRESIGLPYFDEFERYRVRRELSNMTAEGIIDSDTAIRAMIEEEGEWYLYALDRVNKQQGFSTLLRMVGLPTLPYPEGEKALRAKKDEFEAAMRAWDAGNVDAATTFFDENPDYLTRLAIGKEPEEQMQRFTVDLLWDAYNNLSSVDKRIAREALGEEFQTKFLDKDTRNTDSIPVEKLSGWLKMLGGQPIGSLGEDAVPIELAPPEIANLTQAFYDRRSLDFPDWFQLQQDYFALPEGEKRDEFLQENPALKDYWAWRDDFMRRNPKTIPYLNDDPDKEIRDLTVGSIWDIYMNLSSVDKRSVREAFGDEFVSKFLDRDTRNYNAIDIETLSGWLEELGGQSLTGASAESLAPSLSTEEILSRLYFVGGYELVNQVTDYVQGGRLAPQVLEALQEIAEALGIDIDSLLEELSMVLVLQ